MASFHTVALEGKNSILTVYVLWHPRCALGPTLAEQTFKWLCGDPYQPAIRGLGIPVRYRTAITMGGELPVPIDFSSSEHNAVVVLVDDELISGGWDDYLKNLAAQVRDKQDLLLLVSLTANSRNLPPELTAINMLKLDKLDGAALEANYLNWLTHDLCQLFTASISKVTVFISHSKRDGLDIARQVQEWIHRETALADFFDANDIPDGTRFAEVIGQGVAESSVLLVVHTDSYGSREWCRLEVLEAKRRRVPLVILSAVEEGEARSFPYQGNVPVVRWRGIDKTFGSLMRVLLREVLRGRYFPSRVDAIKKLHGEFKGEVFLYPPELLTALLLRTEAKGNPVGIYLYPDPPLGTEELELLRDLDPTLDPVTPTLLIAR